MHTASSRANHSMYDNYQEDWLSYSEEFHGNSVFVRKLAVMLKLNYQKNKAIRKWGIISRTACLLNITLR